MAEFIEFPVFDGVSGDLWQWILWLEDFFVRKKFTADEKMNLAQSLLEGKAYAWFYRNQKIFSLYSWEELRDMLWLMFGDFDYKGRLQKTIPVEKYSTPQQIVEDSVEIVAEILEDEASYIEKKLIPQYQVPIASLEPGLRQSEIVSKNRVHSQPGFECVTNKNNAHHVFDELSLRRHKFQRRKKPSLSPKSRMFKFKTRTLLSNWSQMDLHQVIDISQVNNLSPSFGADFGLVRKKRTYQCLRWNKHAHMSRFLYQMRMLHDPGGMTQLLHGDMQSMFVCVRKFASLLGVICVWADCMMHTTTVISATLYSLFSCKVVTADMFRGLSQIRQVWEPGGVVAANVLVDWLVDFPGYDGIVDDIRCQEIGVCSRIKQPIDSRRASRVWERGGLDISAALTDWLMKCCKGFEFSRLMRKLHKIDLPWVQRKHWDECGWLVFDRGKHKIISGDVITLVFLDLKKCFFHGAEKRDVQTMLLVKAMVAHVDSLIVRIKELGIAIMVEINTGVSWAELKWITWSVSSNIVEVYTKIMDTLQKKLKQGMDLHGASWHCSSDEMNQFHSSIGLVDALQSGLGENVHGLPAADGNELQFLPACVLGNSIAVQMFHSLFIRQQKSSSIWHRWRRKD